MQITSSNWQSAWPALPVKADTTALDVLKLRTPAIHELNRQLGSTEAGKIIFEAVVLGVLDYFDAGWNDMQLADFVEIAHGEYHWLHLAELKHFALQAKKGIFNVKVTRRVDDLDGKFLRTEEFDGKVYGKLTPAKMMQWLEEYAGASLYQRGQMRIEKKDEDDAPPPMEKTPAIIEARATLNALVEQMKETMKAERAEEEAESRRLREEQEVRNKDRIRRYAEANGIDLTKLEEARRLEVWWETLPAIAKAIATRIAAGERLSDREDLQLHENHKDEIEAALRHIQREQQRKPEAVL